jgi:phage shock protein A
MSDPTPSRTVDLDAVAQLVEQLERDLAQARAGTASVDTLRAEVEQLRAALSVAAPSQGEVHESLHGLRARLHEFGDELKSDALMGSDYFTRIGRLLGLG